MKSLVLLLLISSMSAHAVSLCSEATLIKGSICKSNPKFLHPTQFTVGFYPIKIKMKMFKEWAKEGKLKKKLKRKVAPAVIGPDEMLWIIDRHHTSTALMNADIKKSKKYMRIQIIKDARDLSYQEFYAYMISKKYFYLKEFGVGPKSPTKLPTTLKELKDDPYRSLAWAVREAGGFSKLDIPFLEFFWADFFRESGIQIDSSHKDAIKIALIKALKLAKTAAASHLPGYNP